MKTSLGPGSRAWYLEKAGVLKELEKIGFYVVGYGCTTCRQLRPAADRSQRIATGDLVVTSVLSGNRNFEGRVHPEVKMNYLASPPLVVAMPSPHHRHRPDHQPLGTGQAQPVPARHLAEQQEIGDVIAATIGPEMFKQNYADVFRATPAGTPSPRRTATCTRGAVPPPTSRTRRTSMA